MATFSLPVQEAREDFSPIFTWEHSRAPEGKTFEILWGPQDPPTQLPHTFWLLNFFKMNLQQVINYSLGFSTAVLVPLKFLLLGKFRFFVSACLSFSFGKSGFPITSAYW